MEPEIKPVENLDDFSTAKYRDLVKQEPKQISVREETDDEEREDFDLARENIKEIITDTSDLLASAIQMCKASDAPRFYEVTASLIKTLVDTNKDLLDLHKKRKEIQSKQDSYQQVGTQNVQNNTVFVGSGIELLEMLKGNK